jgi:SAM-dependent methyltransferase
MIKVDFERERTWWDAQAPHEEEDRADEAVNRALRWREITRHLEGVRTILDVGGGTGAFSIPLAQYGFEVIHLDLSPAMLEIARLKAGGLHNIRFVEGNAVDLSSLADCSFDLVLALDGAVSFCGDRAEEALLECCRVAGRTLIVSVLHRARLAAQWASTSLHVLGGLAPAVYAMLERGEWHQDQYPENAAFARGSTHDYLGSLHGFLPGELRSILEGAGLQVVRCGGVGSLAGLCPPEVLGRVLADPALFPEFVELCDAYDREVMPEGPGTEQRAGLLAVARRADA